MLVIKLANGNTYPADRCIWRTADDAAGGYKLSHWEPHTNVAHGATPTANDSTRNARLGYVGKSGRFVAYTNDFS